MIRAAKALIAVLFMAVVPTATKAASLSIEGHYQGKNLYVSNPEDEEGFGFCATRVTVNGTPMDDGVASSAFEIDFSKYGLKEGDKILVVIEHGIGCKPKILNPEVLLPRSTFETKEINCTADGLLTWTTTGEAGALTFVVEQKRWNKWVTLGEVEGNGTAGPNEYNFKLDPHSGSNEVRVHQVDHTGKKRFSRSTVFESSVDPIEFSPPKVAREIQFKVEGTDTPAKTRYEIYDNYGNIVKRGSGSSIDCSNLAKGAYFLNYDKTTSQFIKK